MRIEIIAEAGVNHNGSLALARKLVDAAVDAKADYVKFQTFKAERLVSKVARKADYQLKNTDVEGDNSQLKLLKKLELSQEQFREIKKYCDHKQIKFLSTGFDTESLIFLNKLGMDFFKVPSGEITNLPYLKMVSVFRKPIVLSTGMCSMHDIELAIEVLVESGINRKHLTVLHCNTEYPTPYSDVNLNAMNTIKDAFKVQVGYSDHTDGIVIPIAAASMGAVIIEKHFTLNKAMEGPDHKASLEPNELKAMVEAIRTVEKAMGDGIKRPSPSEKKNITIARKSIHIKRDLRAGQVLKDGDVEMLRPGDGISPMDLDKVLGRKVIRKLRAGDKLSFSDLIN